MLAIILYFFAVIFIGFGKELIYFIYTTKWIAAVPALYWFSLSIFLLPAITTWGQVILSIGRSKQIFWSTFILVILGWTLAYIFIQFFGFVGIAMAYFFIYIGLYISYLLILRTTGIKFSSVSIMIPKFVGTVCSIVVAIILNKMTSFDPILLLIKIVFVVGIYIALMFLFARKDSIYLYKMIKERIKLKRFA
jgi:O-antigen/teichoic acid export membrane protein